MIFINGLRFRVGNEFVNGAKKSPINYNPLNLPPYTIRLKYKDGVTPLFAKGTGVQVSQNPNIWDLTYENSDWSFLLDSYHTNLLEVLGANTTGVTNMNYTFNDCTSLISVQLFDTSSVTSMINMFLNCSLTTVPLFDTSKVTIMSGMFDNCTSLITVPLFDTSNVTDMSSMFRSCSNLESVPFFNTSNVTRMEYLFSHCNKLQAVPLFNTSNVTWMKSMFIQCKSLQTIPLFDTSKVTNMDSMFAGCRNVQSGALALYQQASTQSNPPSNHVETFKFCGADTQTGSAELAQIPNDWKYS